MSKPILLSVVVACYNVADYLEECLDSLASQTYKKIEVILIDDKATDNGQTSAIVDKYASKFENFYAYHNDVNLGLGATRNKGITIARGEYIAFVDGDDIVPQDAYLKLVQSVSETGSEVATGFVRRFDSFRDKPSYLHKMAISDTIQATTLEENPELVYDSTSWNKIYSLQMIRNHKMLFPANILYEDIPFVMKSFVYASRNSSVDILSDVVYKWRWREGDNKSITQVKNAMKPYNDRLTILSLVRESFIKSNVSRNVMDAFYTKVLKIDIPLFMDDIADADDDFILDFQRVTYLFLKKWDLLTSPLYNNLSIKMQSQYQALLNGNFDTLKRYSYSNSKGSFAKRVIHKISNRGTDSFKWVNKLTNISDDGNNIYVSGFIGPKNKWVHRVPGLKNNLHEKITAKLINIDSNKELSINISRTRAWVSLHARNQPNPFLQYRLSFNYYEALEKLELGTWKVLVILEYGDQKYEEYVGQPSNGKRLNAISISSKGFSIIQKYNRHWDLVFNAKRILDAVSDDGKVKNDINQLNKVEFKENNICLDFTLREGLVNPGIQVGNESIQIVGTKSDDNTWQYSVPLSFFSAIKGSIKKVVLFDTDTNIEEKYAFDHTEKYRVISGTTDDLFISYKNPEHVYLMLEAKIAYLSDFEWKTNDATRTLKLHIQLPSNVKSVSGTTGSLELISYNKENRYLAIGEVVVSDNRATAELDLMHDNQLDVLKGKYKIYINIPTDDGHERLRLFNENKVVDQESVNSGFADVSMFNSQYDFLVLNVKQKAEWMDRTKLRRGIAYSILYPLMRLLPIDNKLVVFESFWGKYFNGSPKAIYDYMRIEHPEYKFVWIFDNDQVKVDGPAKKAVRLKFKYWYYMARAKYLIQNTNFPNQYAKRKNQIEVETLHGTFMKTMGFDEPHFKHGSPRIQRNFAKRNNRWDLLTVPSDYMEDKAVSAFDFKHEVMKSGFPSNDDLINNNNESYIAKIKKRLNIPSDKKVVLYAPTFRNNDKNFDFEMDLDLLKRKLGQEYVVLVRLHYFVAHATSFVNHEGFVWDVSDYPNISDLYLISDLLITDYSSVMFDYGYLKKPMVFFAYDIDWYLDNANRGVYLDYKKIVPGPVVKTNQDLIEAVTSKSILSSYNDKLQQFYDTFCQYGRDGNAAQKIVERMLELHPEQQESIENNLLLGKIQRFLHLNDFQSRLLNVLSNTLPKTNIVIFESFFGTQFSDSPRAIYEYMKENNPEYKLYWNVNRKNIDYFKQNKIPYVIRFGYKGIIKQARAKYWVTNVRRPFRWQKAHDAKLIQTWHGTPLKSIGTDVENVTMPGVTQRSYHKQVIRDSSRWDYLITPNEYSFNIMGRAFRRPITSLIRSGYPRNDVLINRDNSRISKIKRTLDIDEDNKLVLYAPTWRDNEFVRVDKYNAKLHLDLDYLLKETPENVTILIRTHYLISNQLDLSEYGGRVKNVSDYPDMADLLLVSDVLITDYSSVMFDFANLHRPILLFAYDLKDYGGEIRGFYVNYEDNIPGPLVETNEDLVPVLNDMINNPQRYTDSQQYQRFLQQFSMWENGDSSKQVVNYFLNDKQYVPVELNNENVKGKIRNGAQIWSDPGEPSKNKFIMNLDNSHDEFNPIKTIRFESPLHPELVGNKYYQINIDGINSNVWIRSQDFEES
ncbi:bifunctional glycosyltransferase family 2 protein/CDP-glycerol:glycerophosphate glycerophosphotransferase [Pediococcus argentinicus]|uniref:bifunctional glycosyltransferase/CDP-glycerol:glycerophosphate glycerophosphotransferase n=1 Tax=Pediococcus argentinicus TaxID=480391 RepID=UPI00338EBA28